MKHSEIDQLHDYGNWLLTERTPVTAQEAMALARSNADVANEARVTTGVADHAIAEATEGATNPPSRLDDRRISSRRFLTIGALAAAIALIAGAVVFGLDRGDEGLRTGDSTDDAVAGETDPNREQNGDRWLPMSDSPLEGRWDATSGWTGEEVLIWGGHSPATDDCGGCDSVTLADGAAYNPVSDTWRLLPPSPLEAGAVERDDTRVTAGVWTGEDLVVWTDFPSTGAAYNPATDSWRRLPEAPWTGRRVGASITWTGTSILVFGGGLPDSSDGSDLPKGMAYDPEADQWELLDSGPTPMGGHRAAWADDRLFVVTGGEDESGTGLLSYDPAERTWAQFAGPPLRLIPSTIDPIWTGQRLLVTGWGGFPNDRPTAIYDPDTDSWELAAEAPMAQGSVLDRVWSGSELLSFGFSGASFDVEHDPLEGSLAYDAATDSWRQLPRFPLDARNGFSLVWTGSEAIIWGGIGATDAPQADGTRLRFASTSVDTSLPDRSADSPAEQGPGTSDSDISPSPPSPPSPSPEPKVVELSEAEEAFGDHVAARSVEHYLEALGAEVYLTANGEVVEQQCSDGRCSGPYEVVSVVRDGQTQTSDPGYSVTVRHVETGAETELDYGWFEGRPVINGLPPLEAGPTQPTLVDQLFGDDKPSRVVVERLDAFEVWNGNSVDWVSNWTTRSSPIPYTEWIEVEGDYVALLRSGDAPSTVARLDDPSSETPHPCPELVDHEGSTWVLNRCRNEREMVSPETGEIIDLALPSNPADATEGGSQHWVERGGVTLAVSTGAEGTMDTAITTAGLDLLSDEDSLGEGGTDADGNYQPGLFPGYGRLSTDGQRFAYTMNRGGFAAAVATQLVIRSTDTGAEIGRYELDGAILCIELSGDWALVCEGADSQPAINGPALQTAVVAIHLPTGELTRVTSRAQVFLPSS